MKELRARIERDTNRGEGILLRIEKRYSDFSRYKKMCENLRQEFRDLLKSLDKLEIDGFAPPKQKTFRFRDFLSKRPEQEQ